MTVGWGWAVPRSIIVIVVAALFFGGCANATLTPPLGGGAALTSVGTGGSLGSEPGGGEAPRKTIASKVLAAIALERVTGRKPDPARFTEVE